MNIPEIISRERKLTDMTIPRSRSLIVTYITSEWDLVVSVFSMVRIEVLAVVLLSSIARSHDLCLDGSTPEKRNEEFKICEKYKSKGCCDITTEAEIFEQYTKNVKSKNVPESCSTLIKEMLCQKCSPRSAHLYEGESKGYRTFPHLCKKFCTELYSACGKLLKTIFNDDVCDPSTEVTSCYPNTDNEKHHEVEHSHDDECIPICVEVIVDDTANLVDGAYPPDGSNRLFIVGQNGVVWEFSPDRKNLSKPLLDISSQTVHNNRDDERGLLSMVFHPNFNSNKLIYLFFTTKENGQTGSRIVSMKVSDAGTPMKVDVNSEKVILEYSKPEGNHNGGQLMFGSDGYLYITTGDGGGGGDRHGEHGNGQLLTTLLGKILRIDVNVEEGYRIPGDNPFAQSTGDERKEIYAYGLRNPWRMSQDRATGRIFTGDVGQAVIEEIDIIVKGGNYGWRAFEGTRCFDESMCDDPTYSDAIPPIYSYDHDVGMAIIGGFVYRGSDVPELRGKYVFGDEMQRHIWAIEEHDSKWTKRNICVQKECPNGATRPRFELLLAFAEDEKGELYFFTRRDLSKAYGGTMYKITSPP